MGGKKTTLPWDITSVLVPRVKLFGEREKATAGKETGRERLFVITLQQLAFWFGFGFVGLNTTRNLHFTFSQSFLFFLFFSPPFFPPALLM